MPATTATHHRRETLGDITCEKYGCGAKRVTNRIQIHQGVEVNLDRLPAHIPFGDRSVELDDFGDWGDDNPATSHGYHSRAEWEKSCRAADWCAQHPEETPAVKKCGTCGATGCRLLVNDSTSAGIGYTG